ncbi:MAG: hypothetical protein EBQ92_08160 [Proteobacteria bacterium]|nr:hypothetical protein [Pseudomonadota bacterium]
MSVPHRISAIGDLHLSSKSGVIQHNAKVQYNHADDSMLNDFKGLKPSLVNGDLFTFDGDNVVTVSRATLLTDYVTSTSASDTYLSKTDAGTTYVASADLDSAVATAGYAKTADLPSLSGYQVHADLDADVAALSYIKSTGEFIQSVGTHLSVSANELNVDLSGLLTSADLSGYLQTSDLQTAVTNLSQLEVPELKQGAKITKNKTQAYTGSYFEAVDIPTVNNKMYRVSVKACYNNDAHDAFGSVEYKALWKRVSGTASLIADSDSASAFGACAGDELSLLNSSGDISVQIKGSSSGGVGAAGACNLHVSWQEC